MFSNIVRSCALFASVLILFSPAGAQAKESRSRQMARAKLEENKRISLNLKNAKLLDVLNMFSKKTGWNLVIGPEVGGKVSLNLNEVDVKDALAAVARVSGYAIERIDNILYVSSKNKVKGFSFPRTTEHKTYRLYYMGVDAAASVVKKYLSPHGKLALNKSRDMLFIEDTPEAFVQIDAILSELDRTPKQVLIEAKILEVQLNDGFTYGINWKQILEKGSTKVSAETKGFSLAPSGGSDGVFFSLTTPDLTFLLDALQQEGTLNTLAMPKLLALNHKPARIVIGGRLGFRVTTTSNLITQETVKFLDVGTQLRLTPHIDNSGHILMEIHPEISDGVITEGLPSKTTTEVTTTLLAKDGESIFIGGLIRSREEETLIRIPLLGYIPVLGYLFRRTEIKNVKSEIIVIITPHLDKSAMRPPTLSKHMRNRSKLTKDPG